MRVSRAWVGEKGSLGFRVLDLRGLPAKAWDWRFMDIVVETEQRVLLERLGRRSCLDKAMSCSEEEEVNIESLSMFPLADCCD